MSNGGTHSRGVLSRHTLPFHTSTETIIDWSYSYVNEAPTCSPSNQEDEGQMRGHSQIGHEKIKGLEGLKFIVCKS
jgi:hypothetical protein